jgi:hypothetical protein
VKENKMKLAFLELAKQGKVVNASLIPDVYGDILEWGVEDSHMADVSYVVLLNKKTLEMCVKTFRYKDEESDWFEVDAEYGDQAIALAKAFKLIV